MDVYVIDIMVKQCMQKTHTLKYQGLEIQLSVPNQLNYFRATTFATKEPETLEWIDGLPEECVLWDIGANIGLFTDLCSAP